MRKYRKKTLKGGFIYSKKTKSKSTKRTAGLVLSRRRRPRRRRRNSRT